MGGLSVYMRVYFFFHMTFLVHRSHLLITYGKGTKILSVFLFSSEAIDISVRDLKLDW